MDKGSWILVVIFLTMVFLVALWSIDVSVSAMGWAIGGKVGNGFWTRDPVQSYHLSLWLAIGSWFSLSVIAVKFILGD